MSDTLTAERCELRGQERAALLDAEGALGEFAEAEMLWTRLGATDGVCRAWVQIASLQLRGLGNLHEAGLWLEQARGARGPRGSDAWAFATLARADLLFLRGHAARAAALVDVVVREANGSVVAAAVQGIAVTRGAEQDRYVRLLCDELEHVTPPSARLALLDRLDVCPPLSGSPELRTRLRGLIPSPVCAPQSYPPGDRARLALRDAELDRVLGRTGDGLLKLEHAWRKLGAESAYALAASAARANARRLAAELAEQALARGDGVALVQLAGVLEDAELRARVLGAAQRVLDPHTAGAWPARLLELRARDAASAELALEYRRRAAGIYEAMGDQVRRDRALGRSRGARSIPPAIAEHELRVTARLHRGRLALIARGHNGRIGGVRTASPLEGRDLARSLRDVVASVAGDRGDDVGLQAAHPAVSALAWELAAPALEAAGLRLFRLAPQTNADVTAVQGALRRLGSPLARDGNLGAETSRALQRFQGEHGLPRTGFPDPVTVQRLHQAVTGEAMPRVALVGGARPLQDAYARAGFRALTPTGDSAGVASAGDGARGRLAPPGGDLATHLRDHPVAVVHIQAGLTDHHGTPALDLPARLTPIALDRCIPRDLPAPLVVLDIPDTQRALRNVFATHLAAAGTVRAILATSGAASLPDALGNQGDIYDVTRALRAHDPHTALFARTPSLRFPTPG